MAKYIYPAVFIKDGSVYTVRFPDIEHCYTQGDSIIDAIKMAEDVLCLTLYGMEKHSTAIPTPSDVHDLDVGENGFVSLITCDTLEYRKLYDQRTVKKT